MLQGREQDERRIIVTTALLGLVVFSFLGLWLPLKQSTERLERSVQQERRRLAVMTGTRNELASVAATAAGHGAPPLVRKDIEASTRDRLKPAMLEVSLTGENGLKATFTGTSMPRLVEWISALSKTQRIHVVQLRIRPDGEAISGEVWFSGADE